MKKLTHLLPPIQKALLFFLPILYFIGAAHFRNLLGNLSLRTCDPEYIYFMSGLTLSDGTLKLAHIDNPGTPLQLLVALVFKITHFFRATSVPFVEDVLSNSDLYLSVTSITIAVLTTILLYYSGKRVLRTTQSVFYSVLIQTTPFLPIIWYDIVGRVVPELLMPFPIIFLSILVIELFYRDEEISKKDSVLFALAIALGLTIKLSFLPILLIPLIVINRWKNRLIFLAFTTLFFFIIAFPVTLQFNIFWGWAKSLFLHSGNYGAGESNIIDFAVFKINLNQLINLEKRYLYIFGGLIISGLAYIIGLRKRAEKKIVLISFSIVLAVTIQFMMVGKHYAHRYFIPALMLTPVMIITSTEIIRRIIPKQITAHLLNVAIVLFLISSIQFNRHWLPIKTEALETDIEQRSATWHYASTLEKDSYKIITSQNYGSPFIEYTLMYSLVWAKHSKRSEYNELLKKIYPYTYQYTTWDDRFQFWGEKFDVLKIAASGKNVFLYIERDDKELFDKTISKIRQESVTPFGADTTLLYKNPDTKEVIYLLDLN